MFHNANLFGSCIIHILYTGVLKLKNNSGAKGLIVCFLLCRRIKCLHTGQHRSSSYSVYQTAECGSHKGGHDCCRKHHY